MVIDEDYKKKFFFMECVIWYKVERWAVNKF